MAELSPMMQQYLEIKKQHKDEILFYRIGDFYEMFFEDALTASKELDLTLTGKQCGLEERAPMCGVPFHSYEGYVARLIAKGYKVAICEQVEDPAKAKGLVKRDIIRVVTPGTVIESSMLQDDRNNYIASIYLKGKKAGLCFADVSTGTAHITELAADKIAPAVITELCRFHPSEVLMNPGLLDCREVTAYIKKNMTCSVELVEDERYAPGLVAASLESQFGRDWPQTTGMAENGLVRFAMAALLEYLHDTQIKGVERLKTVVTYNEAQFMRLSPVTRANLELTETLRGREKRGTLLWVLDKTSTAMGKRMLRSWIEQPLLSSKLINQRLNAVESLVRQTVVRGDLTDELHYIADMERLMTRTVYGSATPKEIYTLAQTCEHLPVLRQQATACGCPELAEEIDPLEDIKARIYAAVDPDAPSTLKDGGVIAKGYHTEVDELRSIRDNTKGVLAQLEAIKKENKRRFASYLARESGVVLNTDAIFDVQVKRLHEYKRQLLNVLHIVHLYNQLRDNPNMEFTPQTFLFGAKAAPGYHVAKRIIQLINSLSAQINADPICKDKLQVVFLENYRVSLAEKLMPASELSEQISTAGKEASGTGNMKFMMNGALTIGTLDGANVEMHQKLGDENIFLFGLTADQVTAMKANGYHPQDYYHQNGDLKRVIDQISAGFADKESYSDLMDRLLRSAGGSPADDYMLLADFDSYRQAHCRALETYADRQRWNQMSLINVARSGIFAADRSIRDYARDIWHVPTRFD